MSDIVVDMTPAEKVRVFKEALMAAVSPQDIKDVAIALKDRAILGDPAAIKEFLDRMIGKPTQELIVDQRERRSPDSVRKELARIIATDPHMAIILREAGFERTLERLPSVEHATVDQEGNEVEVKEDNFDF